MPDHLQKYCQYIHNAGSGSVLTSYFDEDWEPVGYNVRNDLMREGLATQDASTDPARKIHLTDAGRALLKNQDPPGGSNRFGDRPC
jgi:hypothetical protein